MKVMILGDVHLGLATEGDPRLGEQAEILGFVEKSASDFRPDVYVNLGDLFDRPSPGPKESALALRHSKAMSKLSSRSFYLTGNHDKTTRGHHHALLPLESSGFGQVVAEPLCDLGQPLLLFLPFVTEWQARQVGYASAQVWLDEFCANSLRGVRGEVFAFGHVDVRGASVGTGGTQRDIGLHVPQVLLDDDRVAHIWLGHIHTHQMVGDKVTVLGSAVSTDFGDVGDKFLTWVNL